VIRELVVVACCCVLLSLAALAQTKDAWPCADEMARAGPYPQVLKPGAPYSNNGLVERKVLPDISDLKVTKLDSTVVIDVILDQEGRVACTRTKGSDTLLVQRSLDAAKQWKYRPYLLNDKPIPIQTQIVFVFENKKVAAK
jgi:hypothetical protein